MAADPKQMAELAKKAAKGGGAKGGGPQHQEPDGDEGENAAYSDDDGDESGGNDQDQGQEFGGHSDKEIADALADLVEKGIVSPAVTQAMQDFDGESGKPEWADESLWNRAVNAVQPTGSGKDEYENPWLIVAATYQLFGGDLPKAGGGDEGGEDGAQDDDFSDEDDGGDDDGDQE